MTYAAFVDSQLQAERRRRETLDARGLAIVTTSGSLVTLLAAVGAFVSSSKTYVVPSRAIAPLIFALGALTIAALLGILANRAIAQDVVSVDTLRQIRTTHWIDNEIDARSFVVFANIQMIESLRRASNVKAKWLFGALSVQVFGLLALSVTVNLVVS